MRPTHIAFNHDAHRQGGHAAYHFGEPFLVEVDIVLLDMPRETHDIGEALQIKIEARAEVEAPVHIDWEWEHRLWDGLHASEDSLLVSHHYNLSDNRGAVFHACCCALASSVQLPCRVIISSPLRVPRISISGAPPRWHSPACERPARGNMEILAGSS